MNFDIRYYDTLSSTIDETNRLYETQQAEVGTVVIASKQTRGRGRFQRTWVSEEGNLFATLMWCAPSKLLFAYPFLTALAITQTLDKLGIKSLSLKWPNDLLLKGKKLGGILLEVMEQQKECTYFSISFGINLLHAPTLTAYQATSIFETSGLKIEPQELLPSILEEFKDLHSRFDKQGFNFLREGFLALNEFKDKAMTIQVGQKAFTGQFHDLGMQGELILKLDDGSLQTFTSGDVSLI